MMMELFGILNFKLSDVSCVWLSPVVNVFRQNIQLQVNYMGISSPVALFEYCQNPQAIHFELIRMVWYVD